jgi:hypothetical protein
MPIADHRTPTIRDHRAVVVREELGEFRLDRTSNQLTGGHRYE